MTLLGKRLLEKRIEKHRGHGHSSSWGFWKSFLPSSSLRRQGEETWTSPWTSGSLPGTYLTLGSLFEVFQSILAHLGELTIRSQ